MPAISRILMTADTVGGVWTYALELIRALGERGVAVDLATMGAPLSRDQRRETAAVGNLALHESSFRLEWMEGPWQDVALAGEWLLELERRLRPDLVHLNGYAHAALPWAAPVLVVAHSCVLSWWRAVKGEEAPAEWDRYRRAVSAGLRSADLVVAPSRAMLDMLGRHYGPGTKARVVPNGRDARRFQTALKEEFVFAAGRLWDEAKSLSALDACAARLPWPVCVAGQEQHPSGGAAAAPHVRLLGRLPASEMSDWLARAAVFAAPARYEPFGLAPLEAALAGCALVLGDIPSLREVWGDAALFVPPADSAALEHTLRLLIENAGARADLAHRARRHALRYSPRRMASGYLDAYRGLISAATAGRPPALAARGD